MKIKIFQLGLTYNTEISIKLGLKKAGTRLMREVFYLIKMSIYDEKSTFRLS